MKWTVEYLNDVVRGETLCLPSDILASIFRIVSLIEEFGLHQVGMPYVRHLEGKLWEMRAKGKDGIARSIYLTTKGQKVVIVRSFIKKTQQTPRSEIRIALQRAKEVYNYE